MAFLGSVGEFFGNTLGGKPINVGPAVNIPPIQAQQYQLPADQASAFGVAPDQQKFLDYLSQGIYNPKSGPSMAEQLLGQKNAENMGQTASMLGSMKGDFSPEARAKMIADQMFKQNQGANMQGSILRAQEGIDQQKMDMARQGMFGGFLEANRGAGMEGARLQAGIGMGNMGAANEANFLQNKLQAEAEMRRQEMINNARLAARQNQAQFIGGLGQAATTLGAASLMA